MLTTGTRLLTARWAVHAALLLVTGTVLAHPPEDHEHAAGKPPWEGRPDFVHDPADQTVQGTVLENPLWYDADVVPAENGLHYGWLEFIPKQGDIIRVGTRRDGKWVSQHQVTGQPGTFARPTLTTDADGDLWLSYERETAKQWDVMAVRLENGRRAGKPVRVSPGAGADINHVVAADPRGGLWFAWQSDRGGQFDVLARHFEDGKLDGIETVSGQPHGDWHPDLAVDPQGTVHVVWDACDGRQFDVYLRSRRGANWKPRVAVAQTPAFEGRAEVALDPAGRTWVAWEEGGANWGLPFRGIQTPQVGDERGPLHRFRLLHVGIVGSDGTVRQLEDSLPMPSVEKARQRRLDDKSGQRSGAFYERARLTVDGRGRLWLVYRHFYNPWLGFQHRSHVEGERGLYARCFGQGGWSGLDRLTVGQGDGLQRLELAPQPDGIAAVWTTGRTDRRRNDRPRGLVVASLAETGQSAEQVALADGQTGASAPEAHIPDRSGGQDAADSAKVTDGRYELFYGDLHRHTDLSLCRVPMDGTIDDAYRYAIEVAGLDYLGITDHSRDIDRGDPLSQLWWRSRKEVYRHELRETFFPFFAYERSHGNTADHNVISLKGNVLRKHTYPVPEFWKELDRNTLTIPHQPIRRDTWDYQNDLLRPLVEIFQGCRDNSIEGHVHEGLANGYHLGFIASSDHMSTSASYACVWAEEADRESIFRALQNRRTFGATDKIRLKVRADGHWMGETLTAGSAPRFQLEAFGTAPVERIRVIVDGEQTRTFRPGKRHLALTHRPELDGGSHYVYFHLVQTDGNEAWSSPVWVKIRSQ